MISAELLTDAFGRIQEVVHEAVAGLTPEQVSDRVDGQTNSIAWLVWHLTRVQDDHVADVAGTEQVWTAAGWDRRFGLPLPSSSTLLTEYYDAVHEHTLRYVAGLADKDFDRIVDEAWDPPVTLGVRLISVISDDLQHAGQAALIRGIVERQKGD
jgi:uncharacterized damage-inducible protein DinB